MHLFNRHMKKNSQITYLKSSILTQPMVFSSPFITTTSSHVTLRRKSVSNCFLGVADADADADADDVAPVCSDPDVESNT